jgi:hypothetical protein
MTLPGSASDDSTLDFMVLVVPAIALFFRSFIEPGIAPEALA